MKIKVVHCVTSLLPDGAQQTLLKLCRLYDRERFEFEVISLRPDGGLEGPLRDAGINVRCLKMYRGAPTPRGAYALCRAVAAAKPDILQGWMYHGNLAASAARQTLRLKIPVFWNIRRALGAESVDRILSKFVIRLSARYSRYADGIIYCAERAAAEHEARGFDRAKRIIVHNGIDTNRFSPRPELRSQLRRRLGLPDDSFLIGAAARFHPQKDFRSLVQAAARVIHAEPKAHFVLAGRNVDYGNSILAGWIDNFQARNSIHLLGPVEEVGELFCGLDLYCQSSVLEGFPNALAEAMASGVPCAATDTGASAEILGGHGQLVPVRSPHLLARALLDLIRLDASERAALGRAARERICREFPLDAVVRSYEAVYEQAASRATPAKAASRAGSSAGLQLPSGFH